MYDEDDTVPISAIEHYAYCPRQCALIYIEQAFEDNAFTLLGEEEHEHVDEIDVGTEQGVRVERALPIWSDRLGLLGRADVVEFPPGGPPLPVEYKHGPRRGHAHDDLQLCAQAVCLEEMLEVAVPRGAVYHVASKRRRVVEFTPEMRAEMERVVGEIRELLRTGTNPLPPNDARCRNCSLIDICLPDIVSRAHTTRQARDIFHVTDAD